MTARDELLDRVVAWFAENGIGDTSLRTLAASIGTSHRMLIYHFGSREGLLSAVVEAVERGERETLTSLMAEATDPFEAGSVFWEHVCASAATFAPLFFELSAAAMQGKAYAAPLRDWLIAGWVEPLAEEFARLGVGAVHADELAHLSLAVARGLLFEASVTGDRAAPDAAIARFTAMVRAMASGPA